MRIARLVALPLVVVAAAVFAVGANDDQGAGKRYTVELDNAFGLIEGADVKVAGVRAGKITTMELDQDALRALIGIRIDKGGFDDLRVDVHCESRPQSLIGEYFLDCDPGTSDERLPDGGRIPVEQTGTVVPLDLINNIMRRPYRERWSILLSELGAGLAARGPDLNETIRRANPALRETDRVLRILAEQRRTIRDLYRDAEQVVGRLAENREEVGRFVEEARDTAGVSASRFEQVRDQWRTFPTFLRELRPTMRRLGESADAQRPALANLNRSADQLETFFETLAPFTDASRPAFRTLAAASRAGRRAVRVTRPNVRLLAEAVDVLPRTARSLAITLEHLDDPAFAVEKDVRAGRGPDGGYTGLEGFLRYIFAQSQAINLYDANNYMLKASVFYDRDCANYQDAETVRNHTEAQARKCRAWIGPNQPGITSPDFTDTDGPDARTVRRRAGRRGGEQAAAPAAAAAPSPAGPGSAPASGQDALAGLLPELAGVPAATPREDAAIRTLDFLLGP